MFRSGTSDRAMMGTMPLSFARTRAPWGPRLVVLAGILLVALNLRVAVTALSPVLDAVRADVPLTDLEAGVLGALPPLSFALFGALTPTAARRWGLERSIVLAMAVVAAGEVGRSVATSSTSLLIASVLAFAGMGAGNVLLPPLVKAWFPDRIGVVTAAYAGALSLSTALPPLLAVPVTAALGWRWAIGWWAVLAVVGALPWLWALRRRLVPPVPPTLPGAVPPGARPFGWSDLVRRPLPWVLGLAFGLNSLISYVLFAWLPQMLRDAGLPAQSGGFWLFMFSILGLPTGMVAPVIAGRMRNPTPVVVVLCVMYGGGVLGLGLDPAGLTALWVVVAGLGSGIFPLLLALIGLRSRTAAGATMLSGAVQSGGYVLAATGPVLAGAVYGATGRWDVVAIGLVVAQVVVAFAASYACRPRYLEDDLRTVTGPSSPPG